MSPNYPCAQPLLTGERRKDVMASMTPPVRLYRPPVRKACSLGENGLFARMQRYSHAVTY